MTDVNESPRTLRVLLAAAALAASLGLAGCAHNAPSSQASGSGVTVYGTVDAGASRTGR